MDDDTDDVVTAEPTEETAAIAERAIAHLKGTEPSAGSEAGAVKDDAGVRPEGTDAPSAPAPEKEPDSWVDDAARELAASYGMTDEDLEQFGSAEEFRRAAIIAERTLGKKASEKPGDQPAGKAEDKPEGKSAETPSDEPEIDLDALERDGWQPEVLNIAKVAKMEREARKAIEKEFAGLKETVTGWAKEREEREAQDRANAFHDAVDQFLDSDRYGKSVDDKGHAVKLDPEARDRREKLWNAAVVVARDIQEKAAAAGKEVDVPFRAILQRAEFYAFGEELLAAGRKKIHGEIARQSGRVRPVPTRTPGRKVPPLPPQEGEPETAGQRALRDPKFKKLVTEMHAESGLPE